MQGDCGVSILEYLTQNPSGHDPEQPAVAAPAFSREIGADDLQSCLSTSVMSGDKLPLGKFLRAVEDAELIAYSLTVNTGLVKNKTKRKKK